MSETFDSIIKYSQRLHWLWSACDHRRGTSDQLTSYREEMRLVQWGILPKLWHLHRVDMAKLAALEEVERTTINHDLLDDYLERAVMMTTPSELVELGGFHVENHWRQIMSDGVKSLTEAALHTAPRPRVVPFEPINTEPHRLPLAFLHKKRGLKRDAAYTLSITAPPPAKGLNMVT